MVSGMGLLIASLGAGIIWETWGAEYTFFTGAAVCVATLLHLWLKPADSMQIS